jgi:hypothetical protein
MPTVPAREFHRRDVELAQIRAELERLADGAEAVIVVEGAPGGNAGGLTGHRHVRHRRPPFPAFGVALRLAATGEENAVTASTAAAPRASRRNRCARGFESIVATPPDVPTSRR